MDDGLETKLLRIEARLKSLEVGSADVDYATRKLVHAAMQYARLTLGGYKLDQMPDGTEARSSYCKQDALYQAQRRSEDLLQAALDLYKSKADR